MTTTLGKGLSEKHAAGDRPDAAIEREIRRRTKDLHLPCAVAFKIASDLDASPAAVGKTADLTGYRLVKCQLGLFGYEPEKKIVKAKPSQHPDLEAAVREALIRDRLPCKAAWEIAARFGLSKMSISGIVEGMGIKIKPCQLGAF